MKRGTNVVDLEITIFKRVNVVALFACYVFLFTDLFYFKHYPLVGLETIGVMIFSAFIFYSRKEKNIPKLILPFIIVLFLIINAGWYVGGGFNSGIALLYLLIIYLTIFIIRKEKRLLTLILVTFNLLALMWFEFNNPGIRQFQTNSSGDLINSYVLLTVSFSIAVFLLALIKNSFEEAREETFKLNKKMLTQSAELQELNVKLISLNENLDSLAKSKTQELEDHNRKLLNFASNNLDKVSKPIHSLVTLTSPMGIHNNPQSLEKIKLAAKELDTEVQELNLKLELEKE